MTKIVRMSEKMENGTIEPFYPETHVEGLAGAENWQKQPITNSSGGPYLNLSSGGKNLLDEMNNLPGGLYTFYCPTNTAGAPTVRATRGLINKTSSTIGWIYSTNDKNEVYTNYQTASGTFAGWNKFVTKFELDDLFEDTGWVNLPLKANFNASTSAPPQYRKTTIFGVGFVKFRGLVNRDNGATGVFATLPSTIIHDGAYYKGFSCAQQSAAPGIVATVYVKNNAEMEIVTAGNATSIWLDNISYIAKN